MTKKDNQTIVFFSIFCLITLRVLTNNKNIVKIKIWIEDGNVLS